MKKILLMISILLSFITTKAQQYLTVQFASQASVPIAQFDTVSKLFIFNGTDPISTIFHNYQVTVYNKKYPTVHLENHPKAARLDRVYVLFVSGNISPLYLDLINLQSTNISTFYLAEKVADPTLIIPNDYNNGSIIACGNIPLNSNAALALINAPQAWDVTEGNPNVIIGIVDEGFESRHEDLINKVLPSVPSYTLGATNSFAHGTAVAGIAACETNNNLGRSSIGNKSSLKLFDDFTTINNVRLTPYNYILKAAQAPNNSKVINVSLIGSCLYNIDEQEIIDVVHDQYHAIIVAAAGNGIHGNHCPPVAGNDDGNSLVYPASYNHVISVSGVGCMYDPNTFFTVTSGCSPLAIPYQNCASGTSIGIGGWKDYFNRFPNARTVCPSLVDYTLTANDKVDLCAVGYDVPSFGVNYYPPGDPRPPLSLYGFGGGTSYATAQVSGTIALMLAVNPNFSSEDVEGILKCTSRDVYEIWENTYYLNKLGTGRLDAGKALQLAQTWIPGSAPTQQAPPTDIRWFEILSNGINTIEVESTCAANSNPGYCNIGYRLEVVSPNPSLTFKWLTFYSENNVGISNNIRYGNSIYLSRGVDYPFINSGIGSIKACVRVNECVPSIYYAEDRASACLGDGCTYNCPADIYITGNYSTPLKESYTWVKSTGQTTISTTTSVKLDGSPTQGYVEFKPTTGTDYLLAAPTATGEFIVQAYNGCDAGAPSFANKITTAEATDEQITTDKLTVYPNPTNGLFYVECKNAISSIQVYNTQGSLVLEKQMSSIKKGVQKIAIDLSNFPSGVYILRSKGENFNYKIVKL
jgi:subtilisin family serine protease